MSLSKEINKAKENNNNNFFKYFLRLLLQRRLYTVDVIDVKFLLLRKSPFSRKFRKTYVIIKTLDFHQEFSRKPKN